VLLAGLAVLCDCRESRSEPLRTINTDYGFSIVLPPGWKTFEEETRDCLVRLGAENGGDGLVYVCAKPRPKDFATSKSEFINREQIKSYVENTLLGRNVECRSVSIQGCPAYETLYLRHVENKHGGVRVQFVNQTFVFRAICSTPDLLRHGRHRGRGPRPLRQLFGGRPAFGHDTFFCMTSPPKH
jgi:hypothetical protein